MSKKNYRNNLDEVKEPESEAVEETTSQVVEALEEQTQAQVEPIATAEQIGQVIIDEFIRKGEFRHTDLWIQNYGHGRVGILQGAERGAKTAVAEFRLV